MLEVTDHWKFMSHIAALIDQIIKKQIPFLLLFPCLKGNNPNNQLQLAKQTTVQELQNLLQDSRTFH